MSERTSSGGGYRSEAARIAFFETHDHVILTRRIPPRTRASTHAARAVIVADSRPGETRIHSEAIAFSSALLRSDLYTQKHQKEAS